jgi:hypothetical protein
MTKEKIPKEIPIHKDKLGRTLEVDDFVAYPSHNTLAFGKVTKLNPKMVGISKVSKGGHWRDTTNKYPHDLVRLDAKDMTWWLIKNS